jgi:hypothetical protein
MELIGLGIGIDRELRKNEHLETGRLQFKEIGDKGLIKKYLVILIIFTQVIFFSTVKNI